jgi:hypothetical protein
MTIDQRRGPVLLHVTMKKNQGRIDEKGILPSCSKGKRRWAYFCTPSGLAAIVRHTCKRYGVSEGDLVVCAAEIMPGTLKRTRYPYYYGSDHPARPLCWYTISEAQDFVGMLP